MTKYIGWSLGFLAVISFLGACAPKDVDEDRVRRQGVTEDEPYGPGSTATGGVGLGTLQRVHFKFDRASLSEQARDRLNNNAEVILDNSNMQVLIEGHTDERGTNEYNIALGERRAKAALDYLVDLGVPRTRLEMKSWGEERLLNNNAESDAEHRKNRRAEFVILEK